MKKKILMIVLLLIMFLPVLNVGAISRVSCGNIGGIPRKIPELTSLFVNIIEVAVPIILVIMGSIDLFKGITSQKDDEMKKGQKLFFKRLIMGAIIFFVIVIVKFIISIVADSDTLNITECIDCFISGPNNDVNANSSCRR